MQHDSKTVFALIHIHCYWCCFCRYKNGIPLTPLWIALLVLPDEMITLSLNFPSNILKWSGLSRFRGAAPIRKSGGNGIRWGSHWMLLWLSKVFTLFDGVPVLAEKFAGHFINLSLAVATDRGSPFWLPDELRGTFNGDATPRWNLLLACATDKAPSFGILPPCWPDEEIDGIFGGGVLFKDCLAFFISFGEKAIPWRCFTGEEHTKFIFVPVPTYQDSLGDFQIWEFLLYGVITFNHSTISRMKNTKIHL